MTVHVLALGCNLGTIVVERGKQYIGMPAALMLTRSHTYMGYVQWVANPVKTTAYKVTRHYTLCKFNNSV